MFEEPEIIRLNIAHYESMLKVAVFQRDHARINALLTEARLQLVLAEDDRNHRKRPATAAEAGTQRHATN